VLFFRTAVGLTDMRFLVATDGSAEADAAVRYAAKHAIALDATLEIVHVLTPETELVGGEIVLPGGDKAVKMGEETLREAQELTADVAEATGGGPPVETRLLTGAPADAVVEYADEADADAIYVGHRGLSEERELVVGSVAKSVVDKASVPVTVIR
jgi:nucleotide-binding universal stress UspA family protein